MSSPALPQWQDKASNFFSVSGVKLKQAGQTATENVTDVAERVGSLVRSRWQLARQSKQQPSIDSLQERLISAAATTGSLLKKGISETKEKVAVGKIKVEEAAKMTATKSKNILNNIERWQKGVASDDGRSFNFVGYPTVTTNCSGGYVFGIPVEVTVQRQMSNGPIPQILVKCADFLISSGLHTEFLFKSDGNKKNVQQLISLFNQDRDARLPEGVNPIDVAIVIKCYLACLPEPLTTYDLYHEIRDARTSIRDLRNVLKKLPNVNYMTLEYVTALLLQVSQKAILNKMDAHILAVELAPVIMWKRGFQRTDFFTNYLRNYNPSKKDHQSSNDMSCIASLDVLSDGDDETDASSFIPLDDGLPTDLGAIEVVQCLVEHHNAVFTDANETTWK